MTSNNSRAHRSDGKSHEYLPLTLAQLSIWPTSSPLAQNVKNALGCWTRGKV